MAEAPRNVRRTGAPLTPPQERRGRVFRIAELMAVGEWKPAMAREVAREWGLATNTVRHMAAEASRLVEVTTGDAQHLRNLARLKIRKWLDEEGPDRAQLVRTLLEHLGELRNVHHVTQAPDPFEGWSEAEISHFADTGELPPRLQPGYAIRSNGAAEPTRQLAPAPDRPGNDPEESNS